MTRRQKRQTRSALDASQQIAAPAPNTIGAAILQFVARERLTLTSALPFEYGRMLTSELANASDAICQAEIIQRYHSLASLLKANARFEGGKLSACAPYSFDSLNLSKAAESARSYAWSVIWNEFNTAIVAIV